MPLITVYLHLIRCQTGLRASEFGKEWCLSRELINSCGQIDVAIRTGGWMSSVSLPPDLRLCPPGRDLSACRG